MSTSCRASQQAILLIDDDELIAGPLRDYLLARGWSVDVAPEPSSAAALMTGRDYGIVVIDPYLTGSVHAETETLIATVRLLQPRSSMIVLTGYSSRALQSAADAYAVTAVVSKPQSVAMLGDLIERIPIQTTV